jgi:hypothetical protein
LSYFVLEADPSASVTALFQEDEPGHDLKWLHGQPMSAGRNSLHNIRIVIDDDYDYDEYDDGPGTSTPEDDTGEIPDFFDTMRAPIGSERFKIALERTGVDNIEIFPAILEDAHGRVSKSHYAINVIGRIACIDHDRSMLSKSLDQIARIASLALREDAIGEAKIFRLHEYPEIIIIRDDVASAIRPLSGVLLSPAAGWSDAHRF